VKNNYIVRGNTVVILIKKKTGEIIEALIDIDDLEKLKTIGSLYVHHGRSTPYVAYRSHENGKYVQKLLHRFLLDDPPNKVVDHINHNGLDNTRRNLRAIKSSENMQNLKGAYITSKSKIRGVIWKNQRKKWIAQVKVYGKIVFDSGYNTKEQAEEAAIEMRRKFMPYATN